MKAITKTVFAFIQLLCAHSCTAEYFISENWSIVNRTEQTITVSVMTSADGGCSLIIPPGGRLCIDAPNPVDSSKHPLRKSESFAHLPAKDRCFVLSGNDILRIWYQSERNEPGKQFFSMSSWEYESKDTGKALIEYNWAFEIHPEDIGLTAQGEQGQS